MKTFVKICGLCTPEDVEAVAELKPDAMGFVFWRKSRRAVKPEDVAEWIQGMPPSIQKVGVFVDSPLAEVARAIKLRGIGCGSASWPRAAGDVRTDSRQGVEGVQSWEGRTGVAGLVPR